MPFQLGLEASPSTEFYQTIARLMDHSCTGQQQFSSRNHWNDSKDGRNAFPYCVFLKAEYTYIILGLINFFWYLGDRPASSTSPKSSRTWITFDPLLRNDIVLPSLPIALPMKERQSRCWALPLAFNNTATAFDGHWLCVHLQNA